MNIKYLDIRPPRNMEEFDQLAQLQIDVWGFDDMQVSPPDFLMLHDKLGGVVLGAFDASGMAVAFTYSFCGIEEGKTIHWSHMLAVINEYRGTGLGKILKFKQREIILGQGLNTCKWTYDPLEGVNCHLNIVTLGATVNNYRNDVYGDSSGHLHAGLPTDRFIAHWQLDSERSRAAADGTPVRCQVRLGDIPQMLDAGTVEGEPVIFNHTLALQEPVIGCPILTDAQGWKARNNKLTLDWRMKTRELFTHYFHNGYRLVDVIKPRDFDGEFFLYILQKD